MAIAKWSALGTESANIAGTAFDSKSSGTTTFVADFDNSSGRDLYLQLWLTLGTFTPTTGASITFFLRRKRSSSYADNARETVTVSVSAGTNVTRDIDAALRLPNGGTWGLYWTSALGNATAASGNALYSQTWNEDVT